jgi:ATP-dependent RNA helicase DHX37/DHR1
MLTLAFRTRNSRKKNEFLYLKSYRQSCLRFFSSLSSQFTRQSQAELPTSLHLQSSATLGTGKATTHRDRLDKLEDKEIRRALDGRAGRRRRHDDSYAVTGPEGDEGSDDEEYEHGGAPRPMELDPTPSLSAASSNGAHVPSSTAVGSALQRNPDGSVVAPKIMLKSRGKKVCPLLSQLEAFL